MSPFCFLMWLPLFFCHLANNNASLKMHYGRGKGSVWEVVIRF